MKDLKQEKIAIILKSVCAVVAVIALLIAYVFTSKEENKIKESSIINPNNAEVLAIF